MSRTPARKPAAGKRKPTTKKKKASPRKPTAREPGRHPRLRAKQPTAPPAPSNGLAVASLITGTQKLLDPSRRVVAQAELVAFGIT